MVCPNHTELTARTRSVSIRAQLPRAARLSGGGSSPRRYFPVRTPPLNGLYTIVPTPCRWHVGRMSSSIPRWSSEYGGCRLTNGVPPILSAAHCASTICEPVQFEQPM